jgi:hypothetical protein
MKRLYGRVLDAPFELIHLISVAAARRRAATADRDMKTIETIASGKWMDGVKDIGSGT